jgi:hypothetical protein
MPYWKQVAVSPKFLRTESPEKRRPSGVRVMGAEDRRKQRPGDPGLHVAVTVLLAPPRAAVENLLRLAVLQDSGVAAVPRLRGQWGQYLKWPEADMPW